MTIITMYRITASYTHYGQCVDSTTAETLGDAMGVIYATQELADAAADELQGSVMDFSLDPSTRYSVVEVPIEIGDVSLSDDEVTADVTLDGHRQTTSWYAAPRRTKAGIDGLQPAGDSIDCWVDTVMASALPADAVVALGLEILAIAGRTVRS